MFKELQFVIEVAAGAEVYALRVREEIMEHLVDVGEEEE